MHIHRSFLTSTCIAACLLAAGCAANRTPYERPAAQLPGQWRHVDAVVPHGAALPDAWWKAFGDAELDALVSAAMLRNNDLAAAAIRIRRAQLQAQLAQNRPTFSGNVGSTVGRSLEGAGTTRSSSVSINASYEVDLWNRVGSQADAARWEALATEQDRESTAQALAGTVATLYWDIGYLNQRLALAAQSIDYAEKTLQLVQAQYAAGAVSSLEVAEARQNVASQRASLTQLQQQRTEAANALALLFDGATIGPAAPDWQQPPALPSGALPDVPAGVPADLLGRRPDLRAAELRLRESLAEVDATRANYYPALSLTGSLGGSSTALGNVLQNPIAALGAGLTLPFLQVTERRLNTEIARSSYEEAVVNFRQTLYSALADVDNALSARQQYDAQGTQLGQVLVDTQTAERLYEVRYRTGAVALSVWLDAQEKRRNAEAALAANRYDRLVNHATLFKALGGGFGSERLVSP